MAKKKSFENIISNILGEPVCNLSHAFYDQYVEANVKFRSKAGMKAVIIRRQLGKCCDWCADLAGIYTPENAPADIYRRHDNCKCMVTYKDEDGYTDVWSKKEFQTQSEARKAKEKELIQSKTQKKTKNEAFEQNNRGKEIRKARETKLLKQNKKEKKDHKSIANDIQNSIIQSKVKTIEYIEDAQNWDELEKKLLEMRIGLDPAVRQLDFLSVRESISGIEYVYEEFSKARPFFKGLSIDWNGIMTTEYSGRINFNPEVYATRESALRAHGIGKDYAWPLSFKDVDSCFGTGAHEGGHILEKALIELSDFVDADKKSELWNIGYYPSIIVHEAYEELIKLEKYKRMSISQLKAQISASAVNDPDFECMAEAIRDVAVNGEDSAPLSKAIWRILKKRLG